jgi:hypothetical protein
LEDEKEHGEGVVSYQREESGDSGFDSDEASNEE